MHPLRPYRAAGAREITARPGCHGFDAGFVAFEKGWDSIRDDDRGLLWEHLVLGSLRSRFADDAPFHWRDKSGRALDFVIRRDRLRVDLVGCKVDPNADDASGINAFCGHRPAGENYVARPGVKEPHGVRRGGRILTVLGPAALPGPG